MSVNLSPNVTVLQSRDGGQTWHYYAVLRLCFAQSLVKRYPNLFRIA